MNERQVKHAARVCVRPRESFKDYQGDCITPSCGGEQYTDEGLCVLCRNIDEEEDRYDPEL